MVRLKHRYILFEILYPPSTDTSKTPRDDFVSYCNSQIDSLVVLHQSSPGTINQRTLTNCIKNMILDVYGDFGLGEVGMSVLVKYFSSKTSTGIIRCGRTNYKKVVGAMTLIEKLEGNDVIIRCTRVSGTIKKSEEYSISRSHDLIRLMNKGQLSLKDFNNLMDSFKNPKNGSDDES